MDHNCKQSSRLLRIEADVAAIEQQYKERDDAMRRALLELGAEIVSIGQNVSEILDVMRETTDRQFRAAFARIDALAKMVGE